MKLPSIFNTKKTKKTSWKWRPFKHLKTISFYVKGKMFKSNHANLVITEAGKFATVLDSSWSQSRCLDRNQGGPEQFLDSVVEAIKLRRLSIEPAGHNTNSILGELSGSPFQDCLVEKIESNDPYVDFRVSMEEMVDSCELKSNMENDWQYLEDLLACYLRMNKKKNHGFIVEAFVDMYAGLPFSPSCSNFSHKASVSSSKSKDCWEIDIERSNLRAEKQVYQKYVSSLG
ncbi:hypothetical protein UlMin_016680 [Ulmus minor]